MRTGKDEREEGPVACSAGDIGGVVSTGDAAHEVADAPCAGAAGEDGTTKPEAADDRRDRRGAVDDSVDELPPWDDACARGRRPSEGRDRRTVCVRATGAVEPSDGDPLGDPGAGVRADDPGREPRPQVRADNLKAPLSANDASGPWLASRRNGCVSEDATGDARPTTLSTTLAGVVGTTTRRIPPTSRRRAVATGEGAAESEGSVQPEDTPEDDVIGRGSGATDRSRDSGRECIGRRWGGGGVSQLGWTITPTGHNNRAGG